jgi:hypothetical protein
MMNKKSTVFVVVFALLLASFSFAQTDFDRVEIKTHPVAGRVSYLEGAGGNIGVLVGDACIVFKDTNECTAKTGYY